jgi:hypothetical protein
VATFDVVIPGDVAPQETLSFDTELPAPLKPGPYVLEVGLQQRASSATFPSVRQLVLVQR